jgi:hypothetical protein
MYEIRTTTVEKYRTRLITRPVPTAFLLVHFLPLSTFLAKLSCASRGKEKTTDWSSGAMLCRIFRYCSDLAEVSEGKYVAA